MAEPDDSSDPLPTQPWSGPPASPSPVTPGHASAAGASRGGWQPPEPEQLQASFPQYEIRGVLGRGGMGAVYQGWQKSLDRLVAIKILPPDLEDNGANFAERFQREAKAMARFSHPGIVAVYDAGATADGLFYFVMEYIEGTDVQKMVRENGPLPPEHALAITAHVCDALAYAHKRGVIHRDIKPANIMVDAEGQVKVADFGLAKVATDDSAALVTGTHVSMGTADFMAPEALYGMGNVDHRADLYAVGVMLYQMLTGEVPRGLFEMPSKHREGIDPRFDEIVKHAMQKDPEKRYASATEIRTDLDKILSEPVPHRSAVEQAPPPPAAPPQASVKAEARPAKAVAVAKKSAASGGSKRWVWLTSGIAATLLVFAGGAVFFHDKTAAPSDEIERIKQMIPPLDIAPTGALEPGAIRLWDAPEKVPADIAGVSWKDKALFVTDNALVRSPGSIRDLILRFSMSTKYEVESQKVGIRNVGTAKEPRKYQLQMTPRTKTIAFRVETPGGGRTLQSWPLPSPKDGGSWLPIELRAVGGDFTISADGEVLGTVHDESIDAAGHFFLSATANGYFRDIVYVPLDKPGAETAGGEKWIDSLAATLAKNAAAPNNPYASILTKVLEGARVNERRDINVGKQKRDGAIRVTFRGFTSYVDLNARFGSFGKDGQQRYSATIQKNGAAKLQKQTPKGGVKLLADIPAVAGFSPSTSHTAEFRVVGDLLTLSLNSAVLGSTRDSEIREGDMYVAGDPGMIIEKLEYLDLDVATTPAPAAPVNAPSVAILTSPDYTWGAPVNLGPAINSDEESFYPTLTADGLEIAFCRRRDGEDRVCIARRADVNSPFGLASPIPTLPPVSSPVPWLSSDGLTLLFSSRKSEKNGIADIFEIRRPDRQSPWSAPVPLGPAINTNDHESAGALSPDGLTLLFASSRPGGEGADDIWRSRRKSMDAPWETPENLGKEINTPVREYQARWVGEGGAFFLSRSPMNQSRTDYYLVTPRSDGHYTVEPFKFPVANYSADPIWHPNTRRLIFRTLNLKGGFGTSWNLWECQREPKAPPTRGAPKPAAASTSAAATKDDPFINSLGMKFVPVPITGGPTDKQRVLFSIWETRVQDYEAFANETKRAMPRPLFVQASTHPVVVVSWDDAQAFCAWLTERERQAGRLAGSLQYRLPTDHEWSCAIGIGAREKAEVSPKEKSLANAEVFPWGANWPPPPGVGNFPGQEGIEAGMLRVAIPGLRDDFPATAPVGSFPANEHGLFDLSGNVSEWCEDLFAPGQTARITRGSSYVGNSPDSFPSARRKSAEPAERWPAFGFRVVLAPAP